MRMSIPVRRQISGDRDRWALCLCLGLIVLPFASTKLVHTLYWDRGVFTSVGEHLLTGDKLYRNVHDNKEPLFYDLVAFQRCSGR